MPASGMPQTEARGLVTCERVRTFIA